MAAAQSKDIASLQEELKAADVSLRTHQLEGIEFMLKCRRAGHGCILADEMGLGKTCQAVVMLSHLSRSSGGRHLILCPLSVIDHWQNELKRFGADRLVVITYRGDKSEREELRDEIAQRKDWHILLTTYELFLKDHEMLPIHKWQSLTVDEAHRLKNSASLLYQALGEEKFDWVMLLTGTPVQNNLTELYSLIMMIDKVKFPAQGADSFVNKYSDSSNPKTMGGLRQLLDEYLLRRTKDVVCPDLPAKSDIVLYHTISAVQKDLYRAILAKNYNYFEKDSKAGGSTVSLNNVLMQLRKCVIHPYLFEGVEPEPFEEGEHLVEASGKLVVLDLLLQYLHAHKHKVLLFSQMTRALDILQDYLSFRGYSYERLDGSVRGEERFAAVKSFNEKESDTFAFLLSTKAGGLGLTLTAADTVVFLDSDFNPQNDLQAAARAHRIGQNKPVKIIRLIARDTVEEIIQARALGKIHLTNAVIGTASADGSETKLTATEITEMITAGLSRLTTDENSAEARFTNEILINILGGTDDNGCWLPAKDVSPIEEEDGAGEKVESSTQKEPVGSMYFFEGKDYKADAAADETALKAILETAKKNVTAPTSQTARRKRTDGDKADFGTLGAMLDAAKERRPRKILTPEEQAERKQKREQAAALRKQRDEEELVEKEQQRRDRRRSQWAENDYESSNLPEPASAEGGDDVDLDERDCGPFFVLGDVAHPQFRTEHEGADALVLHCVDNSGSWGYGGVFDALLSRSRKVKEVYEWAGEMGDVALGDAHMVDIDDSQSRTSGGRDSAVLLVAQHRKSRDEMNMTALSTALSRVAERARSQEAAGRQMSAHIPRIGYGMPKVQWYTVERLIKKYLCRRGVPVYIYYFDRSLRSATRRKRTAPDNDDQPIASGASAAKLPALSSMFHDVTLCLLGINSVDYAKYKRLIFAFDGVLVDEANIVAASHIVIGEDENDEIIIKRIRELPLSPKAVFVDKHWLDSCIKSRSLITPHPCNNKILFSCE